MRVFHLLLDEFLWFAEQACDPLHFGWVWASVFALTKSCVCRRGGHLGGEQGPVCPDPSVPHRVRGGGATGGVGSGISPGGAAGGGGFDSWSVGECPIEAFYVFPFELPPAL